MKFYVCKHCGKVITILNNVNVPTICCGAPMEELKANTVDAAVEKHVPFVTTVGGEIIIKVGEEKHPMTKEHYISFVAIETNQGMFIHNFKPQMVGIGPFIPHHDTPFAHMAKGSGEITIFTAAIVRLMLPNVLLPATTALGTIMENGREMGILAGCNVCMPNISPSDAKTKYTLYDNKLITGAESLSGKESLKERLNSIGYEIVSERGDFKEYPNMF